MNTTRIIIFLLASCLIPSQALAEPSKPISSFIDTPASAFDVFLFRIKESGECYQTYWGNPGGQKLDLCLTGLEYSFDDNIIEMNFFVSKNHELMKGLSGKSQKEIRAGIRDILIKAAETAGVEKFEPIGYFGWIQQVPIRHGWSTKSLDEVEIREEIRKRTRVVLFTDPIDGNRYKAIRSHHGEVTVSPAKK